MLCVKQVKSVSFHVKVTFKIAPTNMSIHEHKIANTYNDVHARTNNRYETQSAFSCAHLILVRICAYSVFYHESEYHHTSNRHGWQGKGFIRRPGESRPLVSPRSYPLP